MLCQEIFVHANGRVNSNEEVNLMGEKYLPQDQEYVLDELSRGLTHEGLDPRLQKETQTGNLDRMTASRIKSMYDYLLRNQDEKLMGNIELTNLRNTFSQSGNQLAQDCADMSRRLRGTDSPSTRLEKMPVYTLAFEVSSAGNSFNQKLSALKVFPENMKPIMHSTIMGRADSIKREVDDFGKNLLEMKKRINEQQAELEQALIKAKSRDSIGYIKGEILRCEHVRKDVRQLEGQLGRVSELADDTFGHIRTYPNEAVPQSRKFGDVGYGPTAGELLKVEELTPDSKHAIDHPVSVARETAAPVVLSPHKDMSYYKDLMGTIHDLATDLKERAENATKENSFTKPEELRAIVEERMSEVKEMYKNITGEIDAAISKSKQANKSAKNLEAFKKQLDLGLKSDIDTMRISCERLDVAVRKPYELQVENVLNQIGRTLSSEDKNAIKGMTVQELEAAKEVLEVMKRDKDVAEAIKKKPLPEIFTQAANSAEQKLIASKETAHNLVKCSEVFATAVRENGAISPRDLDALMRKTSPEYTNLRETCKEMSGIPEKTSQLAETVLVRAKKHRERAESEAKQESLKAKPELGKWGKFKIKVSETLGKFGFNHLAEKIKPAAIKKWESESKASMDECMKQYEDNKAEEKTFIFKGERGKENNTQFDAILEEEKFLAKAKHKESEKTATHKIEKERMEKYQSSEEFVEKYAKKKEDLPEITPTKEKVTFSEGMRNLFRGENISHPENSPNLKHYDIYSKSTEKVKELIDDLGKIKKKRTEGLDVEKEISEFQRKAKGVSIAITEEQQNLDQKVVPYFGEGNEQKINELKKLRDGWRDLSATVQGLEKDLAAATLPAPQEKKPVAQEKKSAILLLNKAVPIGEARHVCQPEKELITKILCRVGHGLSSAEISTINELDRKQVEALKPICEALAEKHFGYKAAATKDRDDVDQSLIRHAISKLEGFELCEAREGSRLGAFVEKAQEIYDKTLDERLHQKAGFGHKEGHEAKNRIMRGRIDVLNLLSTKAPRIMPPKPFANQYAFGNRGALLSME